MAAKPGELQANGWLPVNPDTGANIPWAEAIGGAGTLSDGQLGYEGGCHFVVPIFIYWDDLAAAIPAVLGTNTFTGGQLSRVPPLRHPLFPNLWASRISSIKGVKFIEKTTAKSLNSPASPVARTKLMVLTVVFSNDMGVVLTDDGLDNSFPPVAGIRQEWQRYTTIDLEPAGEMISRKEGSFTFTEGGGGAQPRAGIDQFTQTQGQPLFKPTMIWRTKRIPQVGLFTEGGMGPAAMFGGITFPDNNIVGMVNDGQFPPQPAGGYARGTLLLLPPKFHREPSPLPKDVNIGSPPLIDTFQSYYTLEVPLALFAPPGGVSAGSWNHFPWSDMLWYEAKDSKTQTRTLFEYENFAEIWRLTK